MLRTVNNGVMGISDDAARVVRRCYGGTAGVVEILPAICSTINYNCETFVLQAVPSGLARLGR
jgi:hypothetical protein